MLPSLAGRAPRPNQSVEAQHPEKRQSKCIVVFFVCVACTGIDKPEVLQEPAKMRGHLRPHPGTLCLPVTVKSRTTGRENTRFFPKPGAAVLSCAFARRRYAR